MNNGDSRFPKALLFSFHCGTRYRLSRRHLRELLFGTGSMPPRPNGLQRSTLHTARASPRIAPHSFTASIAYCEQVGVNRQQGFLSGDMNFRYRVISHISTYFMTVYSRGRLGLRYEGFLTGLRPDPPKNILKEGFWISKNFCQKGLWQRFGVAILVYRFYRKRPQHFVPQPCRLFFRKNQSRPQTKSPSFPNAATRSRFTSSEVAPTACPRAEITIRFPVLRLRSDRMPR